MESILKNVLLVNFFVTSLQFFYEFMKQHAEHTEYQFKFELASKLKISIN